MYRICEQIPAQFFFITPFKILAKFVAHEVQLFAWVGELEGIQRSYGSKLLLLAAEHLVHHSFLAMHDFIMRIRQYEQIIVEIAHGESHFIVMISAFIWRSLYIINGIVHKTKVPLIVKAKSAELYRGSDLCVVCGILCKEHNVRVHLLNGVVCVLQEPYTAVVHSVVSVTMTVDKVRNCVISQSVNVIFLYPEIHR